MGIFKLENPNRVKSFGTFKEWYLKQLSDRLFNYSADDLIRIQNVKVIVGIFGNQIPLSLEDKLNLTSIEGIKFQLKNFSMNHGLIYYLSVTDSKIEIKTESIRLTDYIDGWEWNFELSCQ